MSSPPSVVPVLPSAGPPRLRPRPPDRPSLCCVLCAKLIIVMPVPLPSSPPIAAVATCDLRQNTSACLLTLYTLHNASDAANGATCKCVLK